MSVDIKVPMNVYNDLVSENLFYREKIEFLEGEIERIKSPFKNRFKKSAAVKEPVSKTGNLIHFPAVKKENPCQ